LNRRVSCTSSVLPTRRLIHPAHARIVEIPSSVSVSKRLLVGEDVQRLLQRLRYAEWITTYADSAFDTLATTIEGLRDRTPANIIGVRDISAGNAAGAHLLRCRSPPRLILRRPLIDNVRCGHSRAALPTPVYRGAPMWSRRIRAAMTSTMAGRPVHSPTTFDGTQQEPCSLARR
jgi:hypothetical protein